MDELFKTYGGAIITVVAIIALIAIIVVVIRGPGKQAFEDLIGSFFSQSMDMQKESTAESKASTGGKTETPTEETTTP